MFYVHAAFWIINLISCFVCLVSFAVTCRRRPGFEFLFWAFLNACASYMNYVLAFHGVDR